MLRPHMRKCNPSMKQADLPSDSKVDVQKKDGCVVAAWRPSSALADDGVEVYYSGSKREELDVIIDPRHSVIVTVTADKRLIRSNVWMAARDSKHNNEDQMRKLGWTLRFPRIKQVRALTRPSPRHSLTRLLDLSHAHVQVRVMAIPGGAGDKPWYDCMTDQQLEEEITRSEDLSNYKMFTLDKPEKAGRKRKQEKAEGGGILKAARFHGTGPRAPHLPYLPQASVLFCPRSMMVVMAVIAMAVVRRRRRKGGGEEGRCRGQA